jgi:hypothetical protein
MTKIIIAEKQFNKLLETENSNNGNDIFNKYLDDEDELIEYTFIDKKRFHLPVNCFSDDDGVYKLHNHPLWFLMCNGYGRYDFDVLPLSVDDDPKVLINNYKLNISDSDFGIIREFIKSNRDAIIQLANGIIRNTEFLKVVKSPISAEFGGTNGDSRLNNYKRNT